MTLYEIKSEIRKLYPLDGNIKVSHVLQDGLPESWSGFVADTTNTDFVAQCHFATSPERLLKSLKQG